MKKVIKTFVNQGAQGELSLERIDKLPDDAKPAESVNGKYIIGHSESGHHHVVDELQAKFYAGGREYCYLVVAGEYADLVHEKQGKDAHGTLRCPPGTFRVRYQKERVGDVWRRVLD